MPTITKFTDLLYRRQRWIEIIAIFLFFSLIAFRFDHKNIQLLWSDYPIIAIVLALGIAIIVVVWLRIEKHKTNALIHNLQNQRIENSPKMEDKLLELSLRQRAVFDLILKGKSNKEITSELHIEISTLKTHINQIYKILGIKSRRETQIFGNEEIKSN